MLALQVVRPFIEDTLREIMRCTLNLIPETITSTYADTMREIVTLGGRIARTLLERHDLTLLDVLNMATRPTHPM